MLHKTIVAVTVAFALGSSVLPTSAFALASAFGDVRIASAGNAYHGNRVSNQHRWLFSSHGHGYQWDPWGHWGSYYGPMI
jgi:hypothetical protein